MPRETGVVRIILHVREKEAYCRYCGCSDSKGCRPRCSWKTLDPKRGVGTCSTCFEKRRAKRLAKRRTQ
jgi:hypothetical protein